MAEFSRLVITRKGQALIAKMLAGQGDIEFTKISTSSMSYEVDQLEMLEDLANVRQTNKISRITRTNDVAVKVETAFSNTDLTEGYYMCTIGLYATDPEEGEILYAVTIETTGNCYMPAYNGVTVSGAYIQLVSTVGNAENVSIEIDQTAIATIGNIQDLQKQIGNVDIENRGSLQEQIDSIFDTQDSISVIDDTNKLITTTYADGTKAVIAMDDTSMIETVYDAEGGKVSRTGIYMDENRIEIRGLGLDEK